MATDLERFVSAEGRDEQIAAVRRKIDESGVTYIYYQFPSVTGRIMGKGVPAKHWESMARKGFQLVYGATANLFVDRLGEYIGYGPESAELVGLPEPETFQVLPVGLEGRARLVHLLPRARGSRGRRRRSSPPTAAATSSGSSQIRGRSTGLHLRAGTEPEMMWLKLNDDGTPSVEGLSKPYCYHIDQFSRVPADHPQGDRVLGGHGPRHDPGRPRGRAGPARAELQLRSRRAHRRQPLDLPAGLPPGRPGARRLPVLHAEAVHGRVGERLPPQHLALARRRERVRAQGGRGPPDAVADRQATRSAASSSTSAR